MDSAEENSKKDLASNNNSDRGVIMNTEHSVMDWEMTNAIDGAEEVNDASPSPTASTNIVSSVPVEKMEDGMAMVDDMDIESFSFGSELEDNLDEANATRTPELSISFDIKVLQTVVEASARALDIVIGKDVVLVAGKTGVGKSTLLQGIAGKKIVEIQHKTSFSGVVATKTAYDAEDALPAFEIGHLKKSKTNALNALVRGEGDDEIVYLDTPGFEDTSGVEMDIATAALLSQVAKRCKSLRFVIIIHCASLIEDRGGAFRSVLKFARAFVQDFDKSKRSFMFLFSHSDFINGKSKSLTDARKCLQDEILQTAAGTTNQEVLGVLDFIQISLNKRYPFGQVFHPMAIDYLKLIDQIEKLTKVTDLTLARSANMTSSSQWKLESAVKGLVLHLRVALREYSQDIAPVVDTRNMLQFLNEYIDVDCLRKADKESESIIDEHVDRLRSSIADHASRGTSSDVEFKQEHVIALNQDLTQLRELAGPGASDRCIEDLRQRLLDFSETIVDRAQRAAPFHTELCKVFVWAEGFDEFKPIYAHTSCQIVKYASESSNKLKANVHNLGSLSDEDLGAFICNLAILNALCEEAAKFPVFCTSDMLPVIMSKTSTMDVVESVFKAWSAAAEEFVNANDSDVVDKNRDVEILARAARTVQAIRPSLDSFLQQSTFHCHSLKELVEATSNHIESAITERFSRYCTEIGQSKFNLSWKPRLFWMQLVCNHFVEMQGNSWKCMKPSLLAIINSVKSDLRRSSGEINSMCTSIRGHPGMINGENFAKEIICLDECKWVDELLPKDQQFVVKCCYDVIAIVNERIELKRAEITSISMSIVPIDGTCVEAILAFGKIRPELIELERFSTIINQHGTYDVVCCGLSLTCDEILEGFVSKLCAIADNHISSWVCTNSSGKVEDMREIARNLNNVLANVDALLTAGGSDFLKLQSNKIRSKLCDEFAKFMREFKKEFSSFDGCFISKAGYLAKIQACRDLPQVENHLIVNNEAKHMVMELILRAANNIESSIASSSEWDKIDESIVKFKAATVLDPFVGGQVTSCLRTIRRLRERKEEQVDDRMAAMIQNHDFRGIWAFLAPLAKSNDQLKIQKFASHLDDIASIMKDMIFEVKRLLDNDTSLEANLLSISKKMGSLVAAESELQSHLASKLNLPYEINAILSRMNGILCQFTKKIAKSIDEKNFVQMVISRRKGIQFLSNMRQYLHSSGIRDFDNANDKIKGEIEEKAVLKYVENFFSSYFKDGENLFKSMASLKQAKNMGSMFLKLVGLYETARNSIESNVRKRSRDLYESVCESKCFDDGITSLHLLHRHLSTELRDHCSTDLVSHVDQLIGELRCKRKESDHVLNLNGKEYKENLEELALRLDKMRPSNWLIRGTELFFGNPKIKETYSRLCKALVEMVDTRLYQALIALNAGDLVSVQEKIEFLELVHIKAGVHVQIVERQIGVIRKQCVDAFCDLCAEATNLLSSNNYTPFKNMFADYRGFIIHTTCVLESQIGQKNFAHVNQLLFKSLDNAFLLLQQIANADILDSSRLRFQVMHIRSWGSFAADHLTLLHEEVNNVRYQAKPDMTWLDKIQKFCWEHFDVGRDLGKMKYCAILGVVPSASAEDIRKAYKEKARLNHPDKNRSKDATENFRMIKEAEEKLLSMSHISFPTQAQPFDEVIRGIGQRIRGRAQTFMTDRRYGMVEKLLFELRNINILENLVAPKLKTDEISKTVYELVKSLVAQSRVEVDSYWSERNYKDLNDVIMSLKIMERHFKSYPQIFPRSWDNGIGIREKIEDEINALGDKARACLQNRAIAMKKQDDFRRCFIQMGFVLTELPSFKNYTKSVMSGVFESCLNTPWGYGYLFEFGLALQKGDDGSNADEKRVAQMIVNEFSHFKEVLVMVWNQEVLQKPADEVVTQIRGEVYLNPTRFDSLAVDHNQLLDSFNAYEREYMSLVADYIKPDADLRALVHKTVVLARQVAPQNKQNCWGDDLKQAIPLLLAGIFSLLTVLRSGDSYNRIEEAGGSSEIGEKLLMKPHNIQVLSLLLMLGCGTDNHKSIENQLMQIRTGEGKSMILGAASLMFALLGFRVRTVCYSKYLSDRDFQLFEDVFERFGQIDYIKYSQITSYALDTIAAKGNIGGLTESLLRGNILSMQQQMKQINTVRVNEFEREEILLVDEVDVFFGSEFYGNTYNLAVTIQEPEIEEILKRIWNEWSHGGRRPSLNDIKSMPEYQRLLHKLSSFPSILDSEILKMLYQVSKVDEIPYHLDRDNDRIGYKEFDSISYGVHYWYRTCFAYLKELPKLKNKAILSKVLVMSIPCGQFSYANIAPHRILGVSGTVQALSEHERKILLKYGLDKYIYVPSVYGASNFQFDKAGEGIYFEKTTSDFYHRITAQITSTVKEKRAVIVFFQDRAKLDEFVASPNYRQLNRHKKLLVEDMSTPDKSFVISKAATAGQITLSTAIFGRGTDFFGKDEVVEQNGGVHIIQTFLSEELSEEIQIQGRTARQGKQGSYQMILLETDLQSQFGTNIGDKDKIPQKDLYEWLCNLRLLKHRKRSVLTEKKLKDATLKDCATHKYLDSLLAGNITGARSKFEDVYQGL